MVCNIGQSVKREARVIEVGVPRRLQLMKIYVDGECKLKCYRDRKFLLF